MEKQFEAPVLCSSTRVSTQLAPTMKPKHSVESNALVVIMNTSMQDVKKKKKKNKAREHNHSGCSSIGEVMS